MEKSICINCEYNLDCSFTSDKKIIWSCNEYLLAGENQVENNKTVLKHSNTKKLELI
ncbi:hypothetical protein [Mangrovimonas spongiae]|uniref:hypothetical protein n=1 Tax=Mangrovimonas spongiae TaxID=2494697 RepID=UPI0013157229|nr:hypothetical protein [Mangrovimonas spongiae]